VVKSPDGGGYRIVKVEDSKTDFPKDYDKVTYLCEGPKPADDKTKSEPGKDEEKTAEKPAAKSKGKADQAAKCGHTWTTEKEAKECPQCGSTKVKVQSKQRDQLFETWKRQKQESHWQEFVQKISKEGESKVVIYDPELEAMKLEQGQGDPKVLRTVAAKYNEAIQYAGSDPFIKESALRMHLAQVYARLGEKDKQAAELRIVLKEREDPNTSVQLANLLIDQWETAHGDAKQKVAAGKAKDEAKLLLKSASELAAAEQTVHSSIADAYKKLGMVEEEKIEREKAKPKPAVSKQAPEPPAEGHSADDGHGHAAETPADPAPKDKPAKSGQPPKPAKSVKAKAKAKAKQNTTE